MQIKTFLLKLLMQNVLDESIRTNLAHFQTWKTTEKAGEKQKLSISCEKF